MPKISPNGKKIGRPSIKTPQILNTICLHIAAGKSLRWTCEEIGINTDTACNWLEKDKEFAEQYVRARKLQADYFADEVVEIGRSANPRNAYATKVLMDALIWHASKTNKTKYGNEPATQVSVNTAVVILDSKKQEALQERRKAAEARLMLKG